MAPFVSSSVHWEVLAGDKIVARVALYKPRTTWQRLDVLPFAVAYVALHAWTLIPRDGPPTAALALFPLVLGAHLLVFFAGQWSLAVHCAVSLLPADALADASLARVQPAPHSGSEALVPLQFSEESALSTSAAVEAPCCPVAGTGGAPLPLAPYAATFTFQHATFYASEAGAAASNAKKGVGVGWQRVAYPTDSPLSAYLNSGGYWTPLQVEAAAARWGSNAVEIPMPLFWDLMAEHAVAPMFVFQMVCVGLWCLDEYWYYSIFTLVMLVFFEATVCYQRLQSVAYLRAMLRPPHTVQCFRFGSWRPVSSQALVPGDLVSLAASQGGSATDRMVPCDLLVLRGSCIVNEAMLTGESVPQRKDAASSTASSATSRTVATNSDSSSSNSSNSSCGTVAVADSDPPLLLEDGPTGSSPHKRHVVFAGTQVMQHDAGSSNSSSSSSSAMNSGAGSGATAAAASSSSSSSSSSSVPLPPDGGCVCAVLRTGYGSAQGTLMRTVLFAAERVTANSAEAAGFIAVLMVFAIAAAGYVLQAGLVDERRNQFKLWLHCVMIVTSVVPPELPMELSLAVTNSLAALVNMMVFCTEPFRIPFAGRVDVCCFDKTGTLTSDNLSFLGVVPATAPAADGDDDDDDDNDDADNSISKAGAVGSSSDASSSHEEKEESLSAEAALQAARVLGCCHELVVLSSSAGGVQGDPMELALLEASGFGLLNADKAVQRAGPPPSSFFGSGSGLIGGMHSPFQGMNGSSSNNAPTVITTLRRLPFSSDLRRMSVVVHAQSGGLGGGGSAHGAAQPASFGPQQCTWVLTKGAPEAVRPLLAEVPPNFDATYVRHMGRGLRVLCLAYKCLNPPPSNGNSRSSSTDVRMAAQRASRPSLESGLTFAGFALLDCPLKRDSADVVKRLQASAHRCVMITGDGALTAAAVARRVGLLHTPPKQTLVLTQRRLTTTTNNGERHSEYSDGTKDSTQLAWRPLVGGFDQSSGKTGADSSPMEVPFDPQSCSDLVASGKQLVVTGDALSYLLGTTATTNAALASDTASGSAATAAAAGATSSTAAGADESSTVALRALCSHVSVFARVAPAQKAAVVAALNGAGHHTLMCGDGTNDVGALKQAHVGVSILNSPELEKRANARLDVSAKAAAYQSTNLSSGSGSGSGFGSHSTGGASGKVASTLERLAAEQAAVAELERLDPSLVQLGDASIASPFTSRRSSVDCVLAVVRQGRCTLVTTTQVFKILALNCLVSAFMLSTLYLHGVKQGDSQMTFVGLAVAALFFFSSQAAPLDDLAPERPPAALFCRGVAASVVGQASVHVVSLLVVLQLAEPWLAAEDPWAVPDGSFRPNLLNSLVFLLSAWMQLVTFAANYAGAPHTTPLTEHKLLWRTLCGGWALVLLAALDAPLPGLRPLLRSYLELAPLPGALAPTVSGLSAADVANDGLPGSYYEGLGDVGGLGFRAAVVGVLVLNLAVAFGIERMARKL